MSHGFPRLSAGSRARRAKDTAITSLLEHICLYMCYVLTAIKERTGKVIDVNHCKKEHTIRYFHFTSPEKVPASGFT